MTRMVQVKALSALAWVWMAACAAFPSPTPSPTAKHSPTPTSTPAYHQEIELGRSVEGRPMVAHRFGNGSLKVVLLGDMHGATEENTYRLMLEMIDYLLAHPQEVPAQASLWILPSANPDGLSNGTRSNARGVDLNRNFDTSLDSCSQNDWGPDTYNSEGLVPGGGGNAPGSEPETQILLDFLPDAHIVISYHSQAGYVLLGGCGDHAPTRRLGEMLSLATGYIIPASGWTAYPVTGNLTAYLAAQGIAAVEIELTNKRDTEFQRNLDGLRAVLASLEETLVT